MVAVFFMHSPFTDDKVFGSVDFHVFGPPGSDLIPATVAEYWHVSRTFDAP